MPSECRVIQYEDWVSNSLVSPFSWGTETQDHQWCRMDMHFPQPIEQSLPCAIINNSYPRFSQWYLACHFLCGWWENCTCSLFFCLNATVIDPFSVKLFTASQVALTFPNLKTWCKTSSPQHLPTCLHRFPVDCASLLSRNQRTVFPQPFAAHWNTCKRRPPTYSMAGLGEKNA